MKTIEDNVRIHDIRNMIEQTIPCIRTYIRIDMILDCCYRFDRIVMISIPNGATPIWQIEYHIKLELVKDIIKMRLITTNTTFIFTDIDILINFLQSFYSYLKLHEDDICSDIDFVENYPGIKYDKC